MGDYPKLGCVLTNSSNAIQYAGLTLNQGRILVHDCEAYQSEPIEQSFVQMGFLAGLFDQERRTQDGEPVEKESMGENALDMRR